MSHTRCGDPCSLCCGEVASPSAEHPAPCPCTGVPAPRVSQPHGRLSPSPTTCARGSHPPSLLGVHMERLRGALWREPRTCPGGRDTPRHSLGEKGSSEALAWCVSEIRCSLRADEGNWYQKPHRKWSPPCAIRICPAQDPCPLSGPCTQAGAGLTVPPGHPQMPPLATVVVGTLFTPCGCPAIGAVPVLSPCTPRVPPLPALPIDC